MPFSPSPYQSRIFDHIRNENGNVVVVAVAGSGKSTTIIQGLAHTQESAQTTIVAFNADIVKDLKEKLEKLRKETKRAFRNVTIRTFHSLGFGAIRKQLGGNVTVDDEGQKVRNILRDELGPDNFEIYGAFVTQLVNFARGEGIGCVIEDTKQAWVQIIAHYNMQMDSSLGDEDTAIEIAQIALRRCIDVAIRDKLIDFPDMLYLPVLWKLRLWQHDILFCDEGQDTSPIRRELLRMSIKPQGKLYVVGDHKQAIYGFTGATCDALNLIMTEFDCVELPLTVSYRCARRIIQEAQTIVPYIEAAPDAEEGIVETLPIMEALGKFGPHDAILCRTTAPLIELAYHLIGQGIACKVMGRDIGKGLVALVKRMRAQDVDELVMRLEAWRSREVEKALKKERPNIAAAIEDRFGCLVVMVNHLPEDERSISKLLDMITSMFSDTNGCLTLATAHRSKGKEWDRVGILRPDQLPAPWVKQDHEREQEMNLRYVAITRARKHLIWLGGKLKEVA